MSKYSYADLETLVLRLFNVQRQGKKIALLVGSGLTLPNLKDLELGVSSVSDIVQDIKDYFFKIQSVEIYEKYVRTESPDPEKYQAAMLALLSSAGQDELNNVIIRAVLNSMVNKSVITDMPEINPETLEKETQNWYLRKGIDALGEMFVDFNELFAGPILTSNFDPLLEISIRKHGGNPQSIFLVNDGKFLNSKSDRTHSVVHFHGYWHGSDTLHTIDQLKRERPQLKGDLKKILNNSVLLVIGYGGWNDVFTNTILELINEGNNNFDILWCFYENDEFKIEEKYSYVLGEMSNSIGQRVVLYNDIDCHTLFPWMLGKLNANETISNNSNSESIEQESKKVSNNNLNEAFACDVPPNNLFWVGRKAELDILLDSKYKTCFITGFGGQGKSGLASHFVRYVIESKYSMWDWRDCKEEDNKFQTIIISQIERLSKGEYRAAKIANEPVEELINLFFKTLGERKILFVYDNVDRYIDLADFKPIGGLGKLFEEANVRSHRSSFVFTCRPHVVSNSSEFLEIPLKELNVEDTIKLFKEYTPPFNEENIIQIAKQSHLLTNGHALWLTLIAAQAKRGLDLVNAFLEEYSQSKKNHRDNPAYSLAQSTLDVVWKSLNQKQQTLLRGMAEMVTSLDKEELEIIFKPELSLNQFNKAFNFLNSLNLLVIKSHEEKKDFFELHPLVREYILQKYKTNERSKFIMLIVAFYNQVIVWIKPKLDSDSPLSYFEKYTQKAELQINNMDFKGALASLHEVTNQILAAGFSEEYIRVSILLYDKVDWLKAVTEEYQYFHDQVYVFINTIIEKGKFTEVEKYLKMYLAVIQGKSINYLHYCSLNSYYFWFRADYKSAIEWAEKGIELQKISDIGLEIDLQHRLALALRDTKISKNIEKALSLMLRGEDLEDILSRDFLSENFSSVFFGNIGRCLWFQDKVREAVVCYFKSYNILYQEKNNNTTLNKGYACLWIAEYSINSSKLEAALHFLKYCLICWEKEAPIKALAVRKDFEYIINDQNNSVFFATLSNWDVEKYCKQFVEAGLKQAYTAISV